jgi:hypothetical protein
MKDPRFWLTMAGLVFVLLVVSPAWSTDIDQHQSQVSNAVNQGNSQQVNMGSSRAMGFGMGDVDINQCYRSRSWSVLYQDTQPNYWCFANDLDARGNHEAAARVRCSIKKYARIFESQEQCLALSLTAVPEPVAPVIDDDDEDQHEVYERDLAEFESRVVRLEQNREAEAKRSLAAAQAARKAAAEVEAKQRADREYAQQTLEDLKQWK